MSATQALEGLWSPSTCEQMGCHNQKIIIFKGDRLTSSNVKPGRKPLAFTINFFDNLKSGHREPAMSSSYLVGEHFEQFIKSQIQQGGYASSCEVILDELGALEDRKKYRAAKLDALRSNIQQGINSGPGRPVQGAPADVL